MIVRKLRIERGLSQEQLASMAGVSVRTLQRIERGANASPETLKCLAAVLETDFSQLRNGQDMTSATGTPLPDLSENEQKAMEYVRDIRSFYIHAIQYAVVIAGLAVINLFTSPGNISGSSGPRSAGASGSPSTASASSRSSTCSATAGRNGRSRSGSRNPGRTGTERRSPNARPYSSSVGPAPATRVWRMRRRKRSAS